MPGTLDFRKKVATIQLRWIGPKNNDVGFECENGFHSLLVAQLNLVSCVSQHRDSVYPQIVVRLHD
jgi:hypothetical protein